MVGNINSINNTGVEKAVSKNSANKSSGTNQATENNRRDVGNNATQDRSDSYDTTTLKRSELMGYIDSLNRESQGQSLNHSKFQDLVSKVRSSDTESLIKTIGDTSNLSKLTVEVMES